MYDSIQFIKGMDISSLEEVESLGGKFYDKGVESDCLDILQAYGVNYIRLRLWNHPYSKTGEPYGAGNNDIEVTKRLAKRALEHNMNILLDFHYSDFWADPGKQYLPKAWELYTDDQLEDAVYHYTHEVLTDLLNQGIQPAMVQVGNEVTNGLMWPNARVPNYANISRFISAGIRAVKEVLPKALVMIHLDAGGNNEVCRNWFDNYNKEGADYDVIGLSYYPFWHGTLADLEANMKDLAVRYHKKIVIAEVSMGHTMEDYASYETLDDPKRKGMATKPELAAKIEHPMTHEGQCMFMRDFHHILFSIKNNGCLGYFYWEPAWLPVHGSQWATPEAIAYMKEKEGGGNEWANQALFDYDGNALPALEVIRDF